MSRYNNVKVLLESAENYNLEDIIELLDTFDDTKIEDLAEDLAFVLVSLWAMIPLERKLAFKERLTDEIVNVEIKEIANNHGINETNCQNCGGCMWWIPEEGWYHDHPHCIDPDPFLGE